MDKYTLIKPTEEYIEEIRSYRQELFDYDSRFNGDGNLSRFEDISAWINWCQLFENRKTLPDTNLVEADQYMLIEKGTKQILGVISFRHYLNEYLAESGGHIGDVVKSSCY